MTLTPPASALPASVSASANSPASRINCAVRIADIAALRSDRSTIIGQRRIPALPLFDRAFSAFARGTLVHTPHGPVAVEDLHPGDKVATSGGTGEITWIGSASYAPADDAARMPLTRIMADSFGVNRPDSFVSLGAAACLLQTPAHLRASCEGRQIMTPARNFVDGVNVIEVTPPTPVRLFHIALRQHDAIIAGGLEVESFHPDAAALRDTSHTLRDVYMSLFPHIDSLSEFGPVAFERLPSDASDQTAA